MNRKFEHTDDKNLMKAYRLLFSQLGDFSIDAIKGLQLSSIKAAYRSRAKETHPDRSKSLGIDEDILTRKFAEITDAYQSLTSYLERNRGAANRGFYSGGAEKFRSRYYREEPRQKTAAQGAASGTAGRGQNYYPKNFRLLFGQFLYYSGHINFNTLLDAIIWQRRQRAQYGKIAMDWGILTHSDIVHVLKNRLPSEKFGETAVRLGLVNPFQHTAILVKQRKMQCYIGEFFVKKGILTPNMLAHLLKKHEHHNNGMKSKKGM